MRNLSALVCLALAACAAGAEPAPILTVDAAGEPVRARFDAAAGKVRAILLPAPT